MTRTLKQVAAGAAVVMTMALTGACSGGGANDSGATADTVAPAEGGADFQDAPDALRDTGGGTAAEAAPDAGAARTVVKVRAVIRTGEVALTSEDLEAARGEIDQLLVALGGTVDSESTQNARDGKIERSTLVIRVPSEKFGAAMTGVKGIGTNKHADTDQKDVTNEVIDVDERVQTLENSLDRLQDYQREANDIDDLIRFEQQITQREAELQSLKAQQTYLADQTQMATITVYLSTPTKYVAPPGALEDAGFVSGLQSGWSALVDTVVVVLTVIGAVLPFAVLVGLLGVPAWILVRRLARRRAPAAASAGPPLD